MTVLIYDIKLYEIEYDDNDCFVQEIQKDLPHHEQIKDWLPSFFDSCDIASTFYGILQGNIKQCSLKIIKNKHKESVARVTIEGIPGFRFSEKRRNAVWEQMDGQMSDGFGECIDNGNIPGVPNNFKLSI